MGIEEEIWEDIEETEGRYQVSSHGNVRNKKTKKVLKGNITNKGYKELQFWTNGKRKCLSFHRLVAYYFIKNEYPKINDQVNHKDGQKNNNHKDNLEWTSGQKNWEHALEHKFTHENPKFKNPEFIRAARHVIRTTKSLKESAFKLGITLRRAKIITKEMSPMIEKLEVDLKKLK